MEWLRSFDRWRMNTALFRRWLCASQHIKRVGAPQPTPNRRIRSSSASITTMPSNRLYYLARIILAWFIVRLTRAALRMRWEMEVHATGFARPASPSLFTAQAVGSTSSVSYPLRQRTSFLFAKSVLADTSERAELSHDRYVKAASMAKSNLIVETPHGASIHKTEDGQFKVCDGENNFRITRTLYSAEQELGVMETGFSFPYSTAFHPARVS